MGLDMYLGVRTSEGVQEIGYWRKANAVHGWFVRECGGGVDNCQPIQVSKIKLLELHAECLSALIKRADNEVPTVTSNTGTLEIPEGKTIGEVILEKMKEETVIAVMEKEFEDSSDPLRPTPGSFFGGTDKNEYYYEHLMDTAKIISDAMVRYPDGEFIYQASW